MNSEARDISRLSDGLRADINRVVVKAYRIGIDGRREKLLHPDDFDGHVVVPWLYPELLTPEHSSNVVNLSNWADKKEWYVLPIQDFRQYVNPGLEILADRPSCQEIVPRTRDILGWAALSRSAQVISLPERAPGSSLETEATILEFPRRRTSF